MKEYDREMYSIKEYDGLDNCKIVIENTEENLITEEYGKYEDLFLKAKDYAEKGYKVEFWVMKYELG